MAAVAWMPQLNTPDALDAPTPVQEDKRRLSESDPDFQRLHAETVRKLTASLRTLVRELRTEPTMPASQATGGHSAAVSRFIARHVGILKGAYEQGCQEGAKDYWQGVSLRRHPPSSDIDEQRWRTLASFYMPSVAKMAHEAQLAAAQTRAGRRFSEPSVRLAEQHTGVMVAFMLPVDVARRLALPGGEPVDELHITLAYLGDLSEYDQSADLSPLDDVVAAYAAQTLPLTGSVSGLGRFNPSESSEGKAPIIALVNVPGLQEWRAGLVQRLQAAGFRVDKTFAYTPHITLAYVDAGAPMPVKYIAPVSLVLDQVTVAIGDDRQAWGIGADAPSPGALSRSMSMSLDEGDPLDQWLASVDVRVDLQAQLGWAGMQDGYLAAGASDTANPFWFVYWLLDPGARQHCFDCPQLAANSPYNAPGSSGNELWQTPGDGNTECGAGCKCSLSYGPGPTGIVSIDQERLATFLPQDMPPPADVTVGADLLPDEGAGYGGIPGETAQQSQGPAYAPPTVTPHDWLPQVTARATLPAGTDTLSDGQKAALDRFRTAADAWDALADGLPAAPFLWQMTEIPGEIPGEVTAGSDALDALAAEADALPYWEFLTGDQQHELQAMIDAIVDFGDATDALDNGGGGGELSEWDSGFTLGGHPPGYSQNRDAHGRWAPGDGGESGSTGGGSSQRSEAELRAEYHTARDAAREAFHRLGNAPFGSPEHARLQKERDAAEAKRDAAYRRLVAARAPSAHARFEQEEAARQLLQQRIRDEMAQRYQVAKAKGEQRESGIVVHYADPASKAGLKALVGKRLSDEQVASIVGAQHGDTVIVESGLFGDATIHLYGPGYSPDHEEGAAYHAERGLLRDQRDRLIIQNRTFFINEEYHGQGIGTHVLAGEVIGASNIGVYRIFTTAGKGGGMNGYYTWPRLGYNAPLRLSGQQRASLPPALRGARIRSIQDLMRSPAGRDWWRTNGEQTDMAFDPRPGSRSRQVLKEYTREKGMLDLSAQLRERIQVGAPIHDAEEIEWTADDEAAADRAWATLDARWRVEEEAAATGRLSESTESVELSGHEPGYSQNRDAHGRWAEGEGSQSGGAGGGEGGKGGGKGAGAGSGGGKQERPEGARYAGGKLLPAAGYDVSLVVHADGSRTYTPQAVNLRGERSEVPGRAHETFGTREEAVRRTYDLAHEHASTTVAEAHIPVTYLHERAHDVLNERAGHALSDEDVAGLAGALPGMRVEVDRSGMLTAIAPDGSRTYTYVMHRDAHETLAQHGIDHEAGVGLYLSHRLNAEGEQIAFSPRQVQEQVHAAQRLHVVSLITKGRGLEIDAKLLPQLGFTTRINEHLFAELRHRWYDMPQHWDWLHQALNRESFRADWEKNGTSTGLAFDLKPGSWSQKRLQRYINDHTSQETA